jgi:predicted helicase
MALRIHKKKKTLRVFMTLPPLTGQTALVTRRQVELYALEREDKPINNIPTCRLIARKETGVIEVDTLTMLRGVPSEAWEYRLGTYSALEWILERYKEKNPKDPTIAEKFNTYKFADYKETVIELLGRVCAVSVRTMEIVRELGE